MEGPVVGRAGAAIGGPSGWEGNPDPFQNSLQVPRGIAHAPALPMIIADTGNNRILITPAR